MAESKMLVKPYCYDPAWLPTGGRKITCKFKDEEDYLLGTFIMTHATAIAVVKGLNEAYEHGKAGKELRDA